MDLRGAEDVEFGEAGMVGPGDVVPGEVVVSAEVDPVVESSEVLGMGGVGMEGPGNQDIEKSVEGCRHCQELLPSKVKEMIISNQHQNNSSRTLLLILCLMEVGNSSLFLIVRQTGQIWERYHG